MGLFLEEKKTENLFALSQTSDFRISKHHLPSVIAPDGVHV